MRIYKTNDKNIYIARERRREDAERDVFLEKKNFLLNICLYFSVER